MVLKTNCKLSCVSRILSIRSREVAIFLFVALFVWPCMVFLPSSESLAWEGYWQVGVSLLRHIRGVDHMTYKEKQRKDKSQQIQVTAWEISARYKEENLYKQGSQTLEEAVQKHCEISSLEVFNFANRTRWPLEALLYLNYSVVPWFCARIWASVLHNLCCLCNALERLPSMHLCAPCAALPQLCRLPLYTEICILLYVKMAIRLISSWKYLP